MVQAAMALAAQSPLQLTAALGVPVTAVTRQPDVFVTVVPPQPEDKSWVYILVGVLGTLVAVLAVGFVLYRRKMQRKKRGDAPHITTAYKQTHRYSDPALEQQHAACAVGVRHGT
jgi:H+/Cl- antiporter ClcA